MSTADSQIFALGAEVRSLLSGTDRSVMFRTKLAIVFFAFAALVFAILSGDQLVLLARISFAGTALLAPLVVAAILSDHPPGNELIIGTGLAVSIFLLSSFELLPATLIGVRMDLLLLVLLALLAGGSMFARAGGPRKSLRY
jgi:SSS family solute:Na+ symporter